MTEAQFVKLLENKFAEKGYLTSREVGVGYGIADLVLFKLNKTKCEIRKKNAQYKKLENEEFFKIFDFLPEIGSSKKINMEFLSKNLSIAQSTLKYNYLKKLEKDGFVKKLNNEFYFKINGWIPLAKEVIAIEAKLKDWKRGFLQANRYKSFAHKVFLAIPMSKGHLVDKELLKKHNIGLILFDITKNNIKTTKVKKEKPLNWYKFNLATESIMKKKLLCNCPAN